MLNDTFINQTVHVRAKLHETSGQTSIKLFLDLYYAYRAPAVRVKVRNKI